MNNTLIKSHLNRAETEARNSFEKFDALWLAFNVMYEDSQIELGNNVPELKSAIHCAKKLDYIKWKNIFTADNLNEIISIAPIFSERHMVRYETNNINAFNKLFQVCQTPISGVESTDLPKFEALISLLYVVRCNRSHGFKIPDNPRDEEVLNLSVPILETIVKELATKFEIIT